MRGSGNCGETGQRLARRRVDAMAAYDRLPAELRGWLQEAALPWSPDSALRAWRRALLRSYGNRRRALEMMSEIEAQKLAQEAEPARQGRVTQQPG